MLDADRVAVLAGFRDSIIEPLKNTDAEKWPIRSGRVIRLVGDHLATEFFQDLRFLEEQGWSRAQLAALFGTPSRLWRLSHHLLQGLRARSAPVAEQQEAVLAILALIAELKVGSPFMKNGANVVLSPKEADELRKRTVECALSGRDREEQRQWVHRAAGVFWSYAEALYFVAHEVGVEVHGPYRTPDNHALLVRDFFSPSPNELWPEIPQLLNFERLRIATIYDDFKGHLDVYNNIYLEPGVILPSQASAVCAWLDGTVLSAGELRSLIERASAIIVDISALVDSWSLVDIATRYVDIFWWRKRELAIAARAEWRPSESVFSRISEEAIPVAATSNLSEADLRIQFDLTG
jgi:hypothetical protein